MACYLEETQVELLDAIMFDDYETVSNILRSGVNPNFSTSDLINGETTPLHSAVRRNNINIVSILLDHNANVDSIDEDGDTPLYSALSADIDRDIRHLLYARGANVNHINKSGKTPLLQILEDHIFIDTDFHREAVFELLITFRKMLYMDSHYFISYQAFTLARMISHISVEKITGA